MFIKKKTVPNEVNSFERKRSFVRLSIWDKKKEKKEVNKKKKIKL